MRKVEIQIAKRKRICGYCEKEIVMGNKCVTATPIRFQRRKPQHVHICKDCIIKLAFEI